MSNKNKSSSTKDNKSLHSIEKQYDTIPFRIDYIKDLLNGKKLHSMVNFNDIQTEQFINPVHYKNSVLNSIKKGKIVKDDDTLDEVRNRYNSRPTTDDTKLDVLDDNMLDNKSYDTTTVLDKKILNFHDIITEIGGKLIYIKSGTTGHTFKGEVKTDNGEMLNYAVKVVAYPRKEKYGNILDVRRPENAEILMIKTLSYFIVKKHTPHIVLPIGTFNTSIDHFIDLIDNNVVGKDNKKYAEFIERYKQNFYHSQVSILISEWANRGDLLDFIRNNYKEITPVHWKVFFFQVISVLAVIQDKFPGFRHNDLKANNILVHKIKKRTTRFKYFINRCSYCVPNIGYLIKLWDFDFACIPGVVDNKKVSAEWTDEINVKPIQNRYYDMHYFFNTLIKKGFFPQFLESSSVPKEAQDFVNRIVPPEYQSGKLISKRGRVMFNKEFLTPDEVLKNDPYFKEFRNVNTSKSSKSSNKSTSSTTVNSIKTSKNSNSNKKTSIKKVDNSSNLDKLDKLLFEDYKNAIMKDYRKKKYQLIN